MQIVLVQCLSVLFKSGARIGLLTFLSLMVPSDAQSSLLRSFQIQHCSSNMCFSADGERGDISKFGNLLASEKVLFKIKSLKKNDEKIIFCESFTFEINLPYVTCETNLLGKPKVMTWDPAIETFYFYDP